MAPSPTPTGVGGGAWKRKGGGKSHPQTRKKREIYAGRVEVVYEDSGFLDGVLIAVTKQRTKFVLLLLMRNKNLPTYI